MLKKFILLPSIYVCLCLLLFITAKAQNESKEAKTQKADGIAFLSDLKLDSAIESFSKAIELEPDYTSAYVFRGFAYWVKIGDIHETRGYGYRGTEIIDRGIADFRKALELKTDQTNFVYVGLANLYMEKRDRVKAQEIFNELLKLNITKNINYNNRALLYASFGEYEKALKDYETSISVKEYQTFISKCSTYANRAQLYQAMGNYDAAIADYTRQMEISRNYFAHSLRAWTFYLKGDRAFALKDINEAVKIYHKIALPYATRGTIYLRGEKYALALADYSKAIEIKPKNADYYRARANVYWKMEETDLAEADEAKAVEFEKPDEAVLTEN
jgi:tetratricopeptide (TPR) repeat protein